MANFDPVVKQALVELKLIHCSVEPLASEPPPSTTVKQHLVSMLIASDAMLNTLLDPNTQPGFEASDIAAAPSPTPVNEESTLAELATAGKEEACRGLEKYCECEPALAVSHARSVLLHIPEILSRIGFETT